MTQTAVRVVFYVRVSTDEQAEEGHSIDAQLRVLREFAARKGWTVVGEYVDAGKSGKSLRRPKMQELLRDAQATPKRFDVIAVHKLDRFSRSILDTIATLTRLKEIGVSFASATQPIDFTTPEGKAMLMMLAVFAEIYIDNLSTETKKGREERARKGFWNGHVPFGYRPIKLNPATDDERGLEFHPENIEGYRLAIRMCADGKRISEIMQTLNAQGYRSVSFRGVRPFSKDMLFPMLRNRFYLGEVSYKGEWLPGRHPPAIDRETWELAQEQIARRGAQRTDHHTGAARPYILRGLIYCGECGNRLRGWTDRKGTRYYRCPAADKGEHCNQVKAIRASKLEGQIADILTCLRLPVDWLSQALEIVGEAGDDSAQREKLRANLSGQLERLRLMFQLGDVTEAFYRGERDRIKGEIAQMQPVKKFNLERAARVLENFGELWHKANLAEQEEIAHALIERLYTIDGRIATIEPKTDFYPLLAIAAQDAGLCISDNGLKPFSPMSDMHRPVLVIVPPVYADSVPPVRRDHGKEKTISPKHKAKRQASPRGNRRAPGGH